MHNMDVLDQSTYAWIPEYLSQRFEPVIVEVADYVKANSDGAWVDVYKPSPESPKFAGGLQLTLLRARKPIWLSCRFGWRAAMRCKWRQ